jgi:filamentous hemagglutinin
MASQLENQGYNITGGAGRGSDEYIPGAGPGTRGGTFVDVTASNESKTIRIQTIDTLADGVTPTLAEAAAAARIRAAFPNDELRLIPKPK